MPTTQDEQTTPTSVSRKEFHENSEEVVARAIRDGRVIIRNDQGRAVAILSAPKDRLPVSYD